MMISSSLLHTREIPGGYRWTLANRLGQMLQELEQLYGPRDRSYTLLGIEFENSGPRIWYPGNCGNIIIQLSESSLFNEACALHELSHEAVHLLSPSGGAHATVLEEGLATHYSWDYTLRITGVDYRQKMHDPGYFEAALLVGKLLGLSPDFFRKARLEQSQIHLIDSALIGKYCPELPDNLWSILSRDFKCFQQEVRKTLIDLPHASGYCSIYERNQP